MPNCPACRTNCIGTGQYSCTITKKRCLKLLFGGDLRIQSSVLLLDNLAKNKILDLGMVLDTSYVDALAIEQTDITVKYPHIIAGYTVVSTHVRIYLRIYK